MTRRISLDSRRVDYPARVENNDGTASDDTMSEPISNRGAPRVLFVGKYSLEDSAGNAVAVRRMMDAFAGPNGQPAGTPPGATSRYVQTGRSAGEAAFALFGFVPTVVHALHAGEAAALGAELAEATGVPLVVTVTGTDLNGSGAGAVDPGVRRAALARLEPAAAVIVLTEHQRALLADGLPGKRAVRIPQSVVLGDDEFALREALEHVAGPELASKRIALLAGGLRPVKGQLVAIDAFERGAEQLGDWLLVLAGPVLDESYAAQVRERARALANVVYIGEIPHGAMGTAMGQCDVLLNSSESEGEPQVILEAQCASLPVVARRVVGNIALVEDGVTGWLFDGGSDLAALLHDLAADPEKLSSVARSARAARLDRLDVAAEATAHLDLYRAVSE